MTGVKSLNDLIDEGWISASDPPNNDRIVQVAWDDGSTSEKSLCFYDSKSTIPPDKQKFWWSYPAMQILPDGAVMAWREHKVK